MEKDHMDIKATKEEMKINFCLTYKDVRMDVFQLLVAGDWFTEI